MKILFLDDNEDRHLAFDRMLAMLGDGAKNVVHVYTVEETIQALKDDTFVAAFLDHDLAGKAFVEEVEGTGTEVALYISKLPTERIPRKIIIHSWNPAGAERMRKILDGLTDVRKIPFSFGS